VLSYEEVPEPQISATEVLVKIKAASLNHLDVHNRRGLPGVKIPLPHISGSEGAGDVVKVGSEAGKAFQVGDPVVVTPAWSCNRCEYCLTNQEPMCLSYQMLGVHRDGCFAEFVAAPAEVLYPLPKHLSYEEAASIPLVFLTAWHMLVERAHLMPGEDVLVQAAGSGVGIAAVQIAKLFGARVIATASTDEKLANAKKLGADILINYQQKDFADEIREITGKRGVDVIFEHTGAATWEKNILSLGRGGRLVTCGATSGPNAQLDLRYVYRRRLSILGSYMGSRKDMMQVWKFVNQKKLQPVIDSVFPLQQLREAELKMEDRNVFGKIILKP
jgi:NADPH:quinone reductase-like Zn-dependent oxidoreductase